MKVQTGERAEQVVHVDRLTPAASIIPRA